MFDLDIISNFDRFTSISPVGKFLLTVSSDLLTTVPTIVITLSSDNPSVTEKFTFEESTTT